MPNLKIVVTDYIETDLEWEAAECRQLGVDFAAYQLKPADPQQLLEVIADADVVIVNMAKINAEVLQGLKKCRLIIRHGIGYDNVDVEAASQCGIVVSYMPDYCVNEVAEQAMTLIMACQRKLTQQHVILDQSAARQQWNFAAINPIYRLHGKTVGIVGLGRIGGTVYNMLRGFEVDFRIVDPYLSEARRQKFGVSLCSFEQVLEESDVVTIHCPLRWEETYHMFSGPQFTRMKDTAILVNTARGGIVDLAALDQALNQGEIAMAGIDVYEVEPPPHDLPLLSNPRAICTPHLSWLSEEAGLTIRQKIMADVRLFLQGELPANQINKGVSYR
jgi:D-3-phosphoglycerate dehydrogenase / 2-oxoglutarate reductase